MFLRKLEVLRTIWSHPLNQKRKIRSIFRFFYFQVVARVSGRRRIVSWIHGLRFYAAPGETGVTINYYCYLSEPSEMLFMLHFLKKEDTFFDIGANAGSFTLLAKGIIKCHVYSFEPVISTRNRLLANLELNNLSIEHVIPNALGSHKGEIYMTSSLDATNHIAQKSDRESLEKVHMEKLDNFQNVVNVALLKIDVEGFELNILNGANLFLNKKELIAIIIETNASTEQYGGSNFMIVEFLKRYGFNPYEYNPKSRSLKLLKESKNSGNTIFIRDIAKAEDRIESGIIVKINNLSF